MSGARGLKRKCLDMRSQGEDMFLRIPRQTRTRTETIGYLLDDKAYTSSLDCDMNTREAEVEAGIVLEGLEVKEDKGEEPIPTGAKCDWRNLNAFTRSTLRGGRPRVAPSRIQLKGLKNNGNTCYMNCIIQCLYHLQEFRDAIDNKQHECPDTDRCYVHVLRATFAALDEASGPILPEGLLDLVKASNVDIDKQGDPLEFLDLICEQLEDCCPKAVQVFNGTEQFIDSCHCNKQEGILRHFRYITILPRVPVCQLLDRSYGGRCNTCKRLKSNKRIITKYPEVLVVQLERSGQDVRNSDPAKLNDFISFDQGGNQKNYELFGIILHKGAKAASGHHLVYLKLGNIWNRINDATVSRITAGQLGKGTSDFYAFVYRRVRSVQQRKSMVAYYRSQSGLPVKKKKKKNQREGGPAAAVRGEGGPAAAVRGEGGPAAAVHGRVFGEIRRRQKRFELLIPKANFQRLVREITVNYVRELDLDPEEHKIQYRPEAIMALQEVVEAYLVSFFEDCSLCATHGKRVTVMLPDMKLVEQLRRFHSEKEIDVHGLRRNPTKKP